MTRPTASFFFSRSGDKTSGNHRFQFLHTIIPYIHEIDISFKICKYDLPINSVLVALYCIPSFNVFLLAVLDQIFCFSHPPPISSLKTHTIISPLTTHSSSSSTPSRYLRLAMITSSTPEFRPPNWDPLWPQLDSPFQAPPMLGWGKMKNTSTFRSLALKWFLSSFSLFLSLIDSISSLLLF